MEMLTYSPFKWVKIFFTKDLFVKFHWATLLPDSLSSSVVLAFFFFLPCDLYLLQMSHICTSVKWKNIVLWLDLEKEERGFK